MDRNGPRNHMPGSEYRLENLKRLMMDLANLDHEASEIDTVRDALDFATGKRFDPELEAAWHRAYPGASTFMLCPDPSDYAVGTLSADATATCEPPPTAERDQGTRPHDHAPMLSINDGIPSKSDNSCPIRIHSSGENQYMLKIPDNADGSGAPLTLLITPADDVYRLEFSNRSIRPERITIDCVPATTHRNKAIPARWITATVCEVPHDYFRADFASLTIDQSGPEDATLHIRIWLSREIKEIADRLESKFRTEVARTVWWYSPQSGLQGRCPIQYLHERRETELLTFLRTEDETHE